MVLRALERKITSSHQYYTILPLEEWPSILGYFIYKI